MTRNRTPPVRDGVGASSVTLPNTGPWPRVLDFLIARFPTIPASTWIARFEQGVIFDAGGQPMSAEAPFRGQAQVYYYRDLDDEVPVPFEAPIVFQDEFLVVADKPHFLSVLPAGRHVQETLLVRLRRATGIETLAPMHRIDRETAGIVVFVVRPETRDAYQSLFRNRAVEKHYEAVAPLAGASAGAQATPLQFPMRYQAHLRKSSNFMQMEVADGPPNSETGLDLLAADPETGLGHYQLKPVTGRKHQLRAHMNALGIPIVNDTIYPIHRPADPGDFSKPLQLLARSISFSDPVSGARRHFASTRTLWHAGASQGGPDGPAAPAAVGQARSW